jgi:hypothetical protein
MVAAAVLLVVVGWSVYSALSDGSVSTSDGDDNPLAEGNSDGAPSSASTGEAPDDEADAVLDSCSTEITEAEDVVAAADSGVSNWSAHVQARTDLLAGRISEEKMSAVWTRTQDAGPADQQQFNTALQAYGGQPSCGELESGSESQTQDVTDCLARAEAADNGVSAAEAAMDDWAAHLHHMSEYADGGMTAGRAQRLWVEAWREAPENITAYEDARATLSKAPPCAETTG